MHGDDRTSSGPARTIGLALIVPVAVIAVIAAATSVTAGDGDDDRKKLPTGAVVRFGTPRFAAAAGVTAAAVAPDGETFAFGGAEGELHIVRVLDEETDPELVDPISVEVGVPIGAIAFSPDGARLVVGPGKGSDGALRIVDVVGGSVEAKLEGHEGLVREVLWTAPLEGADGRGPEVIVSGGDDRTIRIWDPVKRAETRAFSAGEAVWALALSPRADHVVSAGRDGMIAFREAASGDLSRQLDGGEGTVHAFAFAPDGETMASAHEDGGVRIWKLSGERVGIFPDARTVKEARARAARLRRYARSAVAIAFAPDSSAIAIGNSDGQLQVFSIGSGRGGLDLRAHAGGVVAVAFADDGATIVTCGADGAARAWSRESGEEQELRLSSGGRGGGGVVTGIAFGRDGREVLVADGARVSLYDVARGWQKAEMKLDVPTERIVGACFGGSDASPEIVAFTTDGRIVRWHTRVERMISATTVSLPDRVSGAGPDGIAPAPDRKRGAVFRGGTKVVALVDFATAEVRKRLEHAEPIRWVGWTSGAVVTWAADRAVRVWDPRKGRLIRRIDVAPDDAGYRESQRRPAPGHAISADGRYLALVDGDEAVRLIDLTEGTIFRRHVVTGGPRLVAFSPDGEVLAVACHDGRVRMKGVLVGNDRGSFAGHAAGVSALAWTTVEDGTRIATGSEDTTSIVWDPTKSER